MKVDNNVGEILVTKEKVLKLLKGVNSSKSADADGIHPRFIKETAETLTIHNMDLERKEVVFCSC